MRTSTFSRRTVAIGVVAVLVGVAVGMVTVMTTRSARRDQAVLTAMGGGSEAAQPAPAESVAASDDAGAAEAADAAAAGISEAAETRASQAPGADAEAEAQAAALVPLCADVTARRDAAVEAAAVALGNWKDHYSAQLAFDRGEISSDEAERRWAASKEPAERNLDALTEAVDAIGSDEPCTQLIDDGEVSGSTVEEVEACIARSDLASGALDRAQEPLQGWRDHLQMMASKDRYSTDEYLQMWDRMVAAAPGEMRPFDDAVAAWRDAPACEPSA